VKSLLFPIVLLLCNYVFAQNSFPSFLEGTWFAEKNNTYERWDKFNEQQLKGFSYKMKNSKLLIDEYVDITKGEKNIIYTATVKNQNQGKSIPFTLTQTGNSYAFENPTHDFPKKIVYTLVNPNEILVDVSDGKEKGFRYTMKKQTENQITKDPLITNPNYDAALAKKVAADDYGMKNYIWVILKTGTNTISDKAFVDSCFAGHMSNMNTMVKAGKLIVAGPMGKNDKTYRGIFILNIKDIDEARKLLQTDPAVNAKLLDAELYNWYGSAALSEYLDAADKVWKKGF
jgi:uncharacterized protein YciI